MKLFTLEEIQATIEKEGIGNSSMNIIIKRLSESKTEVPDPYAGIKQEIVNLNKTVAMLQYAGIDVNIKNMPYAHGVPVGPYHSNVVTFDHKKEKCHLYFMRNGNLGITRDSNRNTFMEINKDQLMEFIFSKF